MREELIIHIETGEEQIEANFRNGLETNTIVIGFEQMKFSIDVTELESALLKLRAFGEE